MKKLLSLSLVAISLCLLSSCAAKDNRLDNFTKEYFESFVANELYELSYTKDDEKFEIKKTSQELKIVDNEETSVYLIDEEKNYYTLNSLNQKVIKNEDVKTSFDYLVENYMFEYGFYKGKDSFKFVQEIKTKEASQVVKNYYEYKYVYSYSNDAESGYKYCIDVESGIMVSKTSYGPNASMLNKPINLTKLDWNKVS